MNTTVRHRREGKHTGQDFAFFFIDELEMIIREWIGLTYHRRRHRALVIPEVPGLKLSPLDMFDHGVARAGHLRIPARPSFALHFLEQACSPSVHGASGRSPWTRTTSGRSTSSGRTIPGTPSYADTWESR